ncbi:MAG: HlyC/CorC family transporter [Lactobacillus sp.]|uniref:hemolysin family protein n=1 Tax=Paucilactobacillus vaccinostercus TaxID=176291 RepID=UPI00070ECA77|nr:hemolysin family protein [Paucilactobacillus vaccinostercus]RRG10730.1 MAG: HlyC/CorC family transporter [Lactobacillus sp.]
MDSGQILINLVIILITFFFAAFFVAAEFALVQTRLTALEEQQEARDKPSMKLNRAIKMVTNLNEYLSTTQVGVSVCGIILGWIGESTIESLLFDVFDLTHLPISAGALHGIGAIIGVLVLTYLEVVFTEIVPKNISIDMPLRVMMFVTTPLHWFHICFYPFVWLLNISANGVVRMLGLKPADETDEVLSQGEILSISRNAVKGGELEKNDLLYMERAFELNDKVAKDVMVDRTQLVVIDIKDTISTAINMYLQEKYSRLPVVADNDKDKILGYVFNYDLVRQSRIDKNVSLSKVLRHISTTPESTPITEVLQQMIRKRTPIVVVVDEYGGTSGIVTDKDIYEELFGTVRDEIDDVSDEIIFKQDDGSYKVSGKTTSYDFERYFQTDIKEFDQTESVTITGYVIDQADTIHVGDVVEVGDFDLEVLDYENSYINWFKVTEHRGRTKAALEQKMNAENESD